MTLPTNSAAENVLGTIGALKFDRWRFPSMQIFGISALIEFASLTPILFKNRNHLLDCSVDTSDMEELAEEIDRRPVALAGVSCSHSRCGVDSRLMLEST